MSPPVTSYRKLEKVRREAQGRADRDRAPFVIVLYQDVLYIRNPARARNLVRKHPEARIVANVVPGV